MNAEIKKENWKNTFDELNKRRYLWKTRIEVLSNEFGDQILSENLALNGITLERMGDRTFIDISVGKNTEAHQTHTIKDPSRVAILTGDAMHGDIISLEQTDGTRTLITFIEPVGLLLGFYEARAFAVAA